MFVAFLALAAAAVPKATAIDPGSWFTAEDYPLEAASHGIEGKTRFEVDVSAEGKPTACRIVKSSGSELLDRTTCDIVAAKGRFKPATRRGKPVAGGYSNAASWRLAGTAAMANGYFAAIVDFTKDPEHPACTIVNKGLSAGSTCADALLQIGAAGAGQKLSKLVALMAVATGNAEPFRGEPEWGRRFSFIAIDLYPPKSGGKPACQVIAVEGPAPKDNPCSQYADAGALSNEDKANPNRLHLEQSVFAVGQRAARTAPHKCKSGESAAEAYTCG